MFGGVHENPDYYPYMVYVFVLIPNMTRHFKTECSGIFVTQSAVLTVAHCLYDQANGVKFLDDEVKVRRHYNKTYELYVSTMIVTHPDYDSKTTGNIAIVFTQNISTVVPIPTKFSSEISGECTFYTYGREEKLNKKYPKLQSNQLTVWSETECHKVSPSTTLLCATYLKIGGICKGDDGGSLVCGGFLHGVFVREAAVSPDCVPIHAGKKGDFPYVVFLFTVLSRDRNNTSNSCSGVTITQNKILTAAHCFYASNGSFVDPKNLHIRWSVGEQFNSKSSEKLVPHPDFIDLVTNDIGIVFIKEIIRNVVPLRAFENNEGNCFILGYGMTPTSPPGEVLQLKAVTPLERENCLDITHRNNLICAPFQGSTGGCKGDGGGPLLCSGLIRGILSRGLIWSLEGIVCGEAEKSVSLFENIFIHKDFIRQYTGLKLESKSSLVNQVKLSLTLPAFIVHLVAV